MIELFEKDIIETSIKSSKGNQLKWRAGEYWYKADYTGYEGLSEIISSRMMEHSELDPDEFVVYEAERIQYKNTIFNGCKSRQFLKKNQQLITLERLYSNFYGESLYRTIYKLAEPAARFEYIVNQIERITGINRFDVYLNKVITIDALTLNEDRHLHNIAVILNGDDAYELCPIFDQGAGFLSDTTMDYPMGTDEYRLIDSVKAKTFTDDFDVQLDISEQISGHKLHFKFDEKDVRNWLQEPGVVQNYSEEIRNRVYKVAADRMKRYQYLFA